MAKKNIDRRSFFKLTAITGALAGLSPLSMLGAGNEKMDKPKPKRLLRVAHITDIHVMPGKIPEYGMAAALHGVNGMADKPDFVIAGGDMIMDAMSTSKDKVKEMWKTFHGIVQADNSLDIHHTIGNHDVFNIGKSAGSYTDGKKWACEEFKIAKPYYFFDKGNWRFVILDSIHQKTIPGYLGMLDMEQMDWLKKTLTETPSDKFVCVVSHIPILAVCTMFDGPNNHHHTWKIHGSDLHADAKQIKDIFYQHKNVKACLSGHIHLIDQVEYLGVNYYCNGAVSGAWWGGNNQEFPPVYAVINFYEDGSNDRDLYYYGWKS